MNHRNVAIIAHVDHGKTTLVDGLLRQSHIFRANQQLEDRVMDSGDIERERGITILAKNTAVEWHGEKINIVDTPGHADFGGEVERALTMVDGVLLLVDAAEGPMPQTRFVLRKALARGLKPIVVINKVDRRDARPDEVASLTFDLMVDLGADDDQLDFPIVHAIAREGRAWLEGSEPSNDFAPLFQVIHDHVKPAKADENAPFRFQVANLDYSDYLGRLALGRVLDGTVKPGDSVVRVAPGKAPERSRITKVYTHLGLNRIETERGMPGDIIVLSGLDDVTIGDTLCDPEHVAALPAVEVDEPTLSMTFSPNTSPFAGREG
ncbi:MAG TPA: GTP-binding protein, partial [Trueperaceae bacterium]|nr:GTP-binding protein [Trueperaceae bacterium]